MDLEKIRQEIDAIDSELVRLLEQRLHLVTSVSDFKKQTGKPTLDIKREEAVLEKVEAQVTHKAFAPYIQNNFKSIMKESRAYQDSRKD